MNKSFEIINNEVIVTNDWGRHISTRPITNNIEEILVTENNIEEIQELLDDEKFNQRYNKPTTMLGYSYLGLSVAQLMLCISRFISGNIAGCILHFVASTCFFTSSYLLTIKPNKKKKISTKKIEVLEQKLSEEQEKLSELKKDKTNDLMCIAPERKNISRSVQIEILKDRLNDINLYINHRHKIIRLYKKGVLESELFEGCASRDTINFIIELVKNDIGIEKRQNNKVKQKANDIEY